MEQLVAAQNSEAAEMAQRHTAQRHAVARRKLDRASHSKSLLGGVGASSTPSLASLVSQPDATGGGGGAGVGGGAPQHQATTFLHTSLPGMMSKPPIAAKPHGVVPGALQVITSLHTVTLNP